MLNTQRLPDKLAIARNHWVYEFLIFFDWTEK
jgi:hypothetical protein